MTKSLAVGICCLFLHIASAAAQDPDISVLARQMQSAELQARSTAFYEVKERPDAFTRPDVKRALLRLLQLENDVVATTLRESAGRIGISQKYGEEFGEYLSDVFEVCLLHCDKGGLLDELLRNASNGSEDQGHAVDLLGIVRSRGFSARHRTRIDSALLASAAYPGSFLVRKAALTALRNIHQADRALSSKKRSRIHDVVVAATSDSVPTVRIRAVQSLATIGTPNDLPLLRRIAESDTTRDVTGERMRYPVRAEAQKAILKLQRP